MALLQKIANSSFWKQTGGALMAFGLLSMLFAAANADGSYPRHSPNIDYIENCKYAICAPFDASEWSAKNRNGVAISVKLLDMIRVR